MKQNLVLFLLWTNFSFGQQIDSKQLGVAQRFLGLIQKGSMDSCWELFDKSNVPNVTKEQFESSLSQLKSSLAVFDTFSLTMQGVKFSGDKQLDFYSFKAISRSINIVDEV